MKKIRLVVEKREETGSSACGRLRKRGLIPAVVYGRAGVKNLQIAVGNFRQMMQAKGDGASLIELVCDGESSLAMLQKYQRDARTDHYTHVDFKAIAAHETLNTTLPIRILGEADGVKNFGGILDVLNHSIAVECLPEDLPEHIEIDVNNLGIGHSIRVKDLAPIKGITYKTHADVVLVSCVKVEEEEEPAESEAEEGAKESSDKAAEESADKDKAKDNS